jgi:hypothetical protein
MFSKVSRMAAAASFATIALAVSAPAQASITVVDPCSAGYVNGAIACVGYVGGNLITGSTGSATTGAQQEMIDRLLSGPATSSTGAYAPPYSLNTGMQLGHLTELGGTATLNFGSLTMSGLTVLGAHFGNNTDSNVNNVTAFWLFDFASPTNRITLANGAGSSNAAIFATQAAAVPEPATWAMMLVGFGAIGASMRRSRRVGARHALAGN